MLRWLRVVELHFKKELIVHELILTIFRVKDHRQALGVLMEFVDVDLGPKFDHMPQTDIFFSVPYEESFGDE